MKLKMNRSKIAMLCAFSVIAVTVSIPTVQADGAGAFLGGIAVALAISLAKDTARKFRHGSER